MWWTLILIAVRLRIISSLTTQNNLLLSSFELELQEAAFNLLEDLQEDTVLASRNHRSKRHTTNKDDWTGFIAGLDHHREQLVIDSVTALSFTEVCDEGLKVKWNAAHHQREHYAFAICGSQLHVYTITGTSLSLNERYELGDEAVEVKHVKVYDDVRNELLLFIVVLLPTKLRILYFDEGKCVPHISQDLVGDARMLEMVYLDNVFYTMVMRKLRDGRSEFSLLNIVSSEGQVTINNILTRTMSDVELIKVYVIYNQAFLFFVDAVNSNAPVYRFSRGNWYLFQVLDVPQVNALECFKVGTTHFVAVAAPDALVVYQFTDGRFQLLQVENREGISSILPLNPDTYRDEAVLLVQGYESNGKQFLDVLIHDAFTRTFVSKLGRDCPEDARLQLGELPQVYSSEEHGVSCLATGEVSLEISAAVSLGMGKNLGLIIPYGEKSLLVSMEISLEHVSSPILEQRNWIGQRLDALLATIESHKNRGARLDEHLENVVLYNSDVDIKGKWKVHKLQVPALVSEEDNDVQQLSLMDMDWTASMNIPLDELKRKLQLLKDLVQFIDDKLKDSIQNGTTDKVVLGDISIDGSVYADLMIVGKLTADVVNGASAEETLLDIVHKKSDRLIEGPKSIAGVLTTDSLTVSSTINDVNIDDIVNSSENVTLRGKVTFEGPVRIANDLSVAGRFGGLSWPDDIPTQDSQLRSIAFEDLAVDELLVSGSLDSVVISKENFANILRNNAAGAVLGKCLFEEVVVEGNLEAAGTICGADVAELDKEIVRIDRDEIIPANKIVTGELRLRNDLLVETINGLNFPEDLVLKDRETEITGNKTFTGPVLVGALGLSGLLNNKNFSNVVTLTSDQILPGTVLFTGSVLMEAELGIDILDGMPFDEVVTKGVHPYLFGSASIPLDTVFKGNVTVNGTCNVRGDINGGNVTAVLADLVYADEDEVSISGKKILPSITVEDIIFVGQLNGINPSDHLQKPTDATNTGDNNGLGVDIPSSDGEIRELITGHTEPLSMDSLKSEVPTAPTKWRKLIVEELVVSGSINGIRTQDLVLDGVDQEFTEPLILESPAFEALIVHKNLHLDDDRSVDGIDLSVFDQQRVTLSTDQEIDAPWALKKGAMFAEKLFLGTWNGYSVKDWNTMFVLRNRGAPQTLHGHLDVKKLIVDNLDTSSAYGIDGYDFEEFENMAVDLREPAVFATNVNFANLQCETVNLQGLFNGQHLEDVYNDVVFVGESPVITGKKIFDSLTVVGDVEAVSVNDGVLGETYLLKNADQTIKRPVNFLDTLRVLNDIEVQPEKGDESIPFAPVNARAEFHDGNLEISRPIEIQKIVTASINGQSWEEMLSHLAFIDKQNEFMETVSFSGGLSVRGDIEAGKLNNENLKSFVEDLVFKDENASIKGRKLFQNRVRMEKLEASELVAGQVVPDFVSAASNAVYINRDSVCQGKITMEDLEISGDVFAANLNGNAVPDDFITLNTDQKLEGKYTVNNMRAVGDVSLANGVLVNGVDVSSEYANTWKFDEDCHVSGTKTFKGRFRVEADVEVKGEVNKINFFQEIIPLDANVTIHGEPQFESAIVVGDITTSSLVNNVRLSEVVEKTLFRDAPITTQGNWTFQKPVFVLGSSFTIGPNATLNGFPISELDGSRTSELEIPDKIQDKINETVDQLNRWKGALHNGFFKIEDLHVDHLVDVPLTVSSVSRFEFDGDSYLLVGTESCSSFVYRKKPSESSHSYYAILDNSGTVTKWELVTQTETSVYLALLAIPSADCDVEGAKLWQFRAADDSDLLFAPVQDFGPSIKDIAAVSIKGQSFLYTAGNSLQEWFFRTGRLQVMKSIKEAPERISATNLESGLAAHISAWKAQPEEIYTHIFKSTTSSIDFKHRIQDLALIHTFEMKENVFLAAAEQPEPLIGCRGLKIFAVVAECCLELKQILNVCDVTAVKFFKAGNEPDYYLAVGDVRGFNVYRYRGASGFEILSSKDVGLVKDIHVFSMDRSLYVCVALEHKVIFFIADTIG